MTNHERIVKSGLKCDFHIHSIYSKHKESKGLTSNNTIDNIDVLVSKLTDENNKVEIAAITDHDVFSYEMYSKFKEKSKGKLKLVLPGVEFSIAMEDKDGTLKQIHVIALFNDNDDEKIKNIESVLGNGQDDKGNIKSPAYDELNRSAYSQEKIIRLLDKIGLDVVMIAHQKKTMTTTQKPQNNDFNNLSEDEQNHLLFTEYFQALEFHDKNNELFNNKKSNDFKDENILRFITGSDCHDWNVYPSHDKDKIDNDKFRHTYLKCLPSFRGVSLALTEKTRISLENSFFSISRNYIDNIEIVNNDERHIIPLSKGINAIIGDNSIGKSLLVHKLTNYYRTECEKSTSSITNSIKSSYEKYLKDNNITIITEIECEKIYGFDSQGEIRKKFDQNKLDTNSFISKQKKDNPSIKKYESQIEDYAKLYIQKLKELKEIETIKNELFRTTIYIPCENFDAKTLNLLKFDDKCLAEKKVNKSKEIAEFDKAISSIEFLSSTVNLSLEEKSKIKDIISYLESLKRLRLEDEKNLSNLIEIAEILNSSINDFNARIQIYKTAADKSIRLFEEKKEKFGKLIVSLLEKKQDKYEFKEPSMGESTDVPVERKIFGNLKIITRSKTKTIDDKYLLNLFRNPLKNGYFKLETFKNDESLASAISKYEGSSDPWEEYERKIIDKIRKDFNEEVVLCNINEDDYSHHSSGLNDRMYFEILSNDSDTEGIYIIDQPEDDVSQVAIRDNLISSLRKMGDSRQIILITHNPQFVVNLDVDNVIYMFKNNDSLSIHSGALEYQSDCEDILKDVAETLDGGVITIRKRWKKYEKNINDIIT